LFAQIYYPDTMIYKRIIYLVSAKQEGLCWRCQRAFEGNELIARGNSRKARYYHFECAIKMAIVDDELLAQVQAQRGAAFLFSRKNTRI